MALFGKKKQVEEHKGSLFQKRPPASKDLTHLRESLESRPPVRGPLIQREQPNYPTEQHREQPRSAVSQQDYLADRVSDLAAKGLSQPEIVKMLKTQGYNEFDIEKSITHSIKSGVESPEFPVKERSVKPREKGEPLYPQEAERHGLRLPEAELKRRPTQSQQPLRPSLPAGFGRPAPGVDKRDVEALVEEVVAEKWEGVENRLAEIEDTAKRFESRISSLETRTNQIRLEETNKDKEISSKIDTYKDSMSDLSSKMEGMETVMKNSLSALLETTRSLSDVVESLKKRER